MALEMQEHCVSKIAGVATFGMRDDVVCRGGLEPHFLATFSTETSLPEKKNSFLLRIVEALRVLHYDWMQPVEFCDHDLQAIAQ